MKWLGFIFLLCFLDGCQPYEDDYKSVQEKTSGVRSLVLNPSDTGTSLLSTITTDNIQTSFFNYQPIKQFNKYYIRVDDYRGLIIFTKPDSVHYEFKTYFHVIGAMNIESVDPVYIRIHSVIGTATLDFSDPDTIKPVSFQFKYTGPPSVHPQISALLNKKFPDRKYYFSCPQPGQIIYGWELGDLSKPICYFKT